MGHEDVLVGDEKHRPGRFKEKTYLLEDPHQLRGELERFKMRHEKQPGENGRRGSLRPAKVEPQKLPSAGIMLHHEYGAHSLYHFHH